MDTQQLVATARDIVLIVVMAGLGLLAVEWITRRARRVIPASKRLDEERQQQVDTLARVLRWTAHVLILIAATLMILSNFVDITPLLASVGVAGLAVSLGAQSLIKDLIGGFLILLENQFNVGDYVRMGDVAGTVERLTLRATYLRDVEDVLHIVPNGEVRIVSNVTKGWSGALIDVGVAYEADLDHALAVLEQTAQDLAQDAAFAPELLEPPVVLGPMSLGDWAITVRIKLKTPPGKQWAVARELRKRVLAACERENISLPYPRQEVLVRNAWEEEQKGAANGGETDS